MRRDFLFWGAKVERWLLRFVVLCAVMLVTFQWFTYDPAVRVISKIDDDIKNSSGWQYAQLEHLVTLQLLDYNTLPKARVLVNGEEKGNFKQRYVTVPVSEGDVLEIDAGFYSHSLSFKVLGTHGNVTWPEVDQVFTVDGTVKEIGTIVIGRDGAGS